MVVLPWPEAGGDAGFLVCAMQLPPTTDDVIIKTSDSFISNSSCPAILNGGARARYFRLDIRLNVGFNLRLTAALRAAVGLGGNDGITVVHSSRITPLVRSSMTPPGKLQSEPN